MSIEALINELEEANAIICHLEGYNDKVTTIEEKMADVEKKRSSLRHEITQGSVNLVVGSIFISGFLFCIHVLSLSITFYIILGSIVLAIIIEISSKNNKKEESEEFYNANMPVLLQGKEYYMNLAHELLYSPEFQTATSLIPQDYFDSESVNYLITVLKNKRADSLKEAINLYETHLYQMRMEEVQKEQLEATKESNQILQNQLALEKEQLEMARKQVDYSRQIEKNSRATKRAVRLNTFITLIKK